MADYFAKTVPVRTNGRITVDTYPSGTLSTMGSSLKSLRAGVADAYILGIGALPQDFPASQCSALPGLSFFPDGAVPSSRLKRLLLGAL